ncbi:MAG: hypothetical protein NTX17_02395 [Candidatus Eisenbacteria bacterium]|nr:hypothetical protein [Candidatus Eisenbacteria bacterium]
MAQGSIVKRGEVYYIVYRVGGKAEVEEDQIGQEGRGRGSCSTKT